MVKLNLPTTSICIIFIYRLPTDSCKPILKGLDTILNLLCSTNIEFIICGDININNLVDNCKKRQQLDTLLPTYNLISSVHFPTKSQNGSISAIDISTDITMEIIAMCPFINWLSDHDIQIIKLHNINTQRQSSETQIIRNFKKHSITKFKNKLSYETWDNIFVKNDVTVIFNKFLIYI
jgi:hypothetical protein